MLAYVDAFDRVTYLVDAEFFSWSTPTNIRLYARCSQSSLKTGL